MEWIIGGVLAFLGLGITLAIAEKIRTIKFSKKLIQEFQNEKYYISKFDQSYCAIDFQKNQMTLGSFGVGISYRNTYHFDNIAEISIQKNGNTITSTRTNRGSQLTGAAIGALAFGGVGAIIGGLSGSSTSKSQERVNKISLTIRVTDQNKPIHEIIFFKSDFKSGVKYDGLLEGIPVRAASKEVEEFAAHLANAMELGKQVVSSPTPPVADTMAKSGDTTAQIRELWDLKQQGALTEDEFVTQKARLIGLTSQQKH